MLIFLWGYMGSGKTVVAKKLAASLDFECTDTDTLVEQREGLTIAEIFETRGETFFRKAEHEILVHLCATSQNMVIATGGGLPCYNNNHLLMSKSGVTVYLELNARTLLQRLKKNKAKRPLLKSVPEENLLSFIEDQLQARRKYYESATIKISGENMHIKKLAMQVRGLLALTIKK